MKRLLVCLIIAASLGFIAPTRAMALSGGDWRAGRIIDDSVFNNKNSMSVSAIQNFLNSKVPVCDTNGTGLYNGVRRSQVSASNPAPFICVKDYYENPTTHQNNLANNVIPAGGISAAQIIYDAAQSHNINPQVLIVMLQKEQALITDDWPWTIQYRSAMGYGCPDTAPCDTQYYGFYNQVNNAAAQFNYYAAHPNSFRHKAFQNNNILYNPNTACGSSSVFIESQATAGLYNYTPYQPNGAALNNLYGTGDGCSAYGNRNFWRLYSDWFGSVTGPGNGFTLAISDSGNLTQYVIYGSIKQAIPDGQTKLAWGLADTPILTVSDSYLNSIANGPPLDRLMRLNSPDSLLYFIDNGKRYAVTDPNLLSSWGISGMTISSVSQGLFNVPRDGGYLSYDIKDPGSASIYMTDGLNGGGARVIRPFQSETVFRAWEGDTAFYTEVSDDFFDKMNDAIGTTLPATKFAYGGSEYQAVNGTRLNQPLPYAQLFPGVAQSVSASTYNRLKDGGSASHMIRSASQPNVYMVDNGTKHAITSGSLLQAWSPPGSKVSVVNTNYVNLIPTGDAASTYGASNSGTTYLMNSGYKVTLPSGLASPYTTALNPVAVSTPLLSLFTSGSLNLTGFLRGQNSPEVYLLDNSGRKRLFDGGQKATLYGAFSTGVTVLPDELVSNIPSGANVSVYVGDGTTEYLIENGTKHPISGSVKTDWGLSSPQVYSDGTLGRLPTAAAMQSKIKDGNFYYLIKSGKSFLSVDANIAETWDLKNAPQMNQYIVYRLLDVNMLTRFIKPTSPSDTRTFIVDKGVWYNLSAAQFANLGGPGAPVMGLDPVNAPSSITNWTAALVKSESNTHYVIDGGGKRYFMHQSVIDQWTNFGALNVPSVSTGFLNNLPTLGYIERTVKGSQPTVYTIWGGSKQHILYPDTYNRLYAPFMPVSDSLINALPTGPDI